MQSNIDRASAVVILLMLVGWALPGIFVRFLPQLPLLELSAWRLIPAALPFLVLLILSSRFRIALITILRDPTIWFPVGCMAGYYVISNIGLRYTPIAIVALLISLAPVWVMIYERFSGRSQSPREVLGVALAFLGLLMCLWPGLNGSDDRITLIGVVAAIASGFVSAVFVIIMRKKNNNDGYRPLAVSFLIFLMGVPLLLLSGTIESPYGVSNLPPDGIFHLLALGILSTATPTLCYAIISSRLPTVTTALMNLLVPPSAAVAAWFILGEHLPWVAIIGGVVSLCGLLIVVTRKLP